MVPLCLHEDAGPFTKKRSCNVISWRGLLSRAGERLSQSPVATFIKDDALPPDDEQAVWQPILREFEQLAREGVGGRRFLLMFARADLQNRCDAWRLPHFNG